MREANHMTIDDFHTAVNDLGKEIGVKVTIHGPASAGPNGWIPDGRSIDVHSLGDEQQARLKVSHA